MLTMICPICQKRSATVHETQIDSDRRVKRDRCEVCAGMKTEQQWEDEMASSQSQESEAMTRQRGLIHREFFEPRLTLMKAVELQTHGMCVWPAGNLTLVGVRCLTQADPMEILLGPPGLGQNHVVQRIGDCELHIVRWDADPQRLLDHIFEPFPEAGARLDIGRGLLLVEAESTLCGDSEKSYIFCNLAAGLFSWNASPYGTPYRFCPKALAGQKSISWCQRPA